MLYCEQCGHQVHEVAPSCPGCGAVRNRSNSNTQTIRVATPPMGGRQCQNCGRNWGIGRSCQFCRQVEGLATGVTLASPIERLAAVLIESAPLGISLFGIWNYFHPNDLLPVAVSEAVFEASVVAWVAYAIWTISLCRRGQSPGKFLLGLRIVRLADGGIAGFGTCFLRDLLAKPLIGVLSIATAGIVNFWLLWDRDTQQLWDKIVGTVVIDDVPS